MLNKIQKIIHSLALSVVVFTAGFNNANAANLSISNIPLFLGNSVQPNIFFVLDDSGSMDWEILMNGYWSYNFYDPDPIRNGSFNNANGENDLGDSQKTIEGRAFIYANTSTSGALQRFVYLYDHSENMYGGCNSNTAEAERCNNNASHPAALEWRIRSSSANVTFYNPGTVYTPWDGPCGTTSGSAYCTDASYTAARYNPKNGEPGYSSTRNLATDGSSQNSAFIYDVWIDDSGYNVADGMPRRGDNFNETGVAAGAAAAPNNEVDLWDSHIRIQIDATSATVSRITYDPRTTAEGSRGLNETTQVLGTISGADCYDVLGSNANVIATTQGALPVVGAVNGTGCISIAQAQTNIANWYQYSRKRMFGSKSAITSVIDAQPKFRYGITQFEDQSLFVEVPAAGVADTAAHNLDMKHDIYRQNQDNISTDLLEGVDVAGRYFDNTDGRSDPIKHSCQKNFEIVFTDGFWNISRSLSDQDGDGIRDVGADFARKYYMRDLSPLDNIVVPDSGSEADLDPDGDEKTWQHLVTFTVAYGVQGAMTDGDGDGWPDQDVNGNPWSTPGTPDIDGAWGDARGASPSNPAKIDDLWHMAWNTNGTYANANNPEEVVEQLVAAITEVASRVGSASAVALNSGTLNANTRIFQAKFNSTDWSGDLESIPVKPPEEIDPLTGSPVAIPATCTAAQKVGSVCGTEWRAGEELESVAYSARNVYSRNTDTNAAVIFKTLADLGATQQTALMTHPDTLLVEAASRGQDRLDFVLGKNSFAAPDDFRKRTTTALGIKKLGDIISSSPTFVGEPSSLLPDGLEAAKYSLFAAANKNRRKMIYVGANDGMLHGFDAADGSERFAYIPGSLVTKLNQLTSTDYIKQHAHFIDGSPQTFDIYKGGWKTVLSSGAGAGGQLVFALDVTNPDAFGVTKALWDFTDANDADMGYTMGDVKFARMNNGQWVVIFGNGFNNTEADGSVSATGNGAIYVVDAYTGALVKKFDTKIGTADDPTGVTRPNGIAEVTAVDLDGDLDVDFLYAGDLFGNLWKVDVSSSSTSSWDFAYKSGSDPKAFYTAKDAAGKVQPITSGVSVKRHPINGKQTLVLFGTGQYFEVGDDTVGPTSQMQSFYSIWDDNIAASAAAYDRTNLLQHKVLEQKDVDNLVPLMEDFRTTSSDAVATYQIDWDTCGTCKAHKGWFIDLLHVSSNPSYPTEYGERVIRKPVLRGNRVIFVTLIPDADACGFGGSGWIMEVDADSGSRLPESPFDVNGDGVIDNADILALASGDAVVSGVRSKEGIVATPGILNNPEGGEFKYFSGTSGNVDVVTESTDEAGKKRQSYRQLR